MKYRVVVVLHESDGIVTLVDDRGSVVAVSDAIAVRDIAQSIFAVIDVLCDEVGTNRDAIEYFDVQSDIGENAITSRIVRTIASTFAYAKNTAKI